VKGPGAEGINKPAILIATGVGVGAILLLASNGFAPDPSKRPADTKPMMSAPVRPEVAQGAVRSLPANYEQAAQQQAARAPAQPPVLGPPLPGDVAAFASDSVFDAGHPADDWSYQQTPPPTKAIDPSLAEAEQAERSQIFFALRQELKSTSTQAQRANEPTPDQITVRRQPPAEPQAAATPSSRALFPGAVIAASLVTEVNSESPGPVIAQVTQSVYDSATGRILLIPQGARLIGDYKSSTRYGQSRIAIMWSRIIMPNGDEIALDEAALDPSGTAGVSGKVDNHWWDVFGAAALGTLINVGVASTEDPQLTYGGVGFYNRDPVEQAINDGAQRTASIVTNRVVDRSLSTPPTIKVESGKRVTVIVSRRTQF
jgi:type IV secretion system protein VirB10